MIWRVSVSNKENIFDVQGDATYRAVQDLGIKGIRGVRVLRIYNIDCTLTREQIEIIGKQLLIDPVTQTVQVCLQKEFVPPQETEQTHVIEIAYNPGVMDPVEHSTIKGIRDLGFGDVAAVRTATQYFFHGTLSQKTRDLITTKVLANKLIQHAVAYADFRKESFGDMGNAQHAVVMVDLLRASSRQLQQLSRGGQLFLSLDEMKTIQNHFRKIGRNPTDCELETIAQTWSEHCYHKTFRCQIDYQWTEKGKTRRKLIRSLLKSTIAKATHELNKAWCVSVFHDNAGVIKFDNEDNVCFKVETHNHPSALEPFGGANTGIGGVIRDILGTGLGAKPICSTDVFCFALPDADFDHLPPGTLHPKRVMKGVVSGVRDYGNKMGIPTVNGAIVFDPRFVGNPLVFCGNVGMMPKDKVFKKVYKGDRVVVVGGRTGRDGIHGATFSSGELTTESEVVSSGAVQIGDPIQEKKVLDVLLRARDLNLYTAVTDCGAGGLSSAVGEMGAQLGARVDLENVPLKYDGLNYDEIWISESQERMVLSVPAKNVERLLALFAGENVEATVIGEFTGTGRLELFYRGMNVCDLDMNFLHEGNPRAAKTARWKSMPRKEKKRPVDVDLTQKLLDVLGHYNVCSKEWVIRQYDHEVQGGSVIKPLAGPACDGPSDASVIMPKLGSFKGIAIANGINCRYGMIDPYWMAGSCIEEAVRQVVAVGGRPDRIAILDNFCWGNPDKPDRLGSLVRAAQGCYQFAKAYGVPFISGKDSLYNEYAEGKKTIAIPGTLLISAIGIVDDVRRCVTMDFKKSGNLIYVVGETKEEMGGSIYLDTLGDLGAQVPTTDPKSVNKIFFALYQAIQKGYAASVHDCSEGGLSVAIAEMAFAGGYGATVRLDQACRKKAIIRDDVMLFSESNGRFVVEVAEANARKFELLCRNVSCACVGRVESSPEFVIYGLNREVCIHSNIQVLKEAWQRPLRW